MCIIRYEYINYLKRIKKRDIGERKDMKEKYIITDCKDGEAVEEAVVYGIRKGNLRSYFYGMDSDYRIVGRDTGSCDLTDVGYLIEAGLYPVFQKYGFGLAGLTKRALEEMINGDPKEYSQVYQYVVHEMGLRDKYSDLPFTIVDKEFIDKMKKSKNYSGSELLESVQGIG